MKGRDKLTGQILNVFARVKGGDVVYVEEGDDERYSYPSENIDVHDTTDWEQRRYEIAKECLACMWSKDSGKRCCIDEMVGCAVESADALIGELKRENNYGM